MCLKHKQKILLHFIQVKVVNQYVYNVMHILFTIGCLLHPLILQTELNCLKCVLLFCKNWSMQLRQYSEFFRNLLCNVANITVYDNLFCHRRHGPLNLHMTYIGSQKYNEYSETKIRITSIQHTIYGIY